MGWRIQTASRLHLGLLSLAAEQERWPDYQGTPVLPARRFGGVGLMLDAPGLILHAEPSSEWSAEGPLAARTLAFARRLTAAFPEDPPRRLVLEHAPREHVGLGVGTQLGLAVTRLVLHSWGREGSLEDWARLSGRGQRSALGMHGFAHGGLLVEAGKSSHREGAPLVVRLEFPVEWPILLIVPTEQVGRHGPEEREAFTRVHTTVRECEALCRIVLLGMLPALIERDWHTFGQAVFDYNARAGSMFASEQGGIYSSSAVAELVDVLRKQGCPGVGQSSWGPGVFAFPADEEQARRLARLVESLTAGKVQTWVTHAANQGAKIDS